MRLISSSDNSISIHAPARGATFEVAVVNNSLIDFNPRSREGSDVPARIAEAIAVISIHAPARGATVASSVVSTRLAFQSTLPRGERLRSQPTLVPI